MMRIADVAGLLGTLHSVDDIQGTDLRSGVLSVRSYDYDARAEVQHEVPVAIPAHLDLERHLGHPRMWTGELCRHQGRLVLRLSQPKPFSLVPKGDVGQGEAAQTARSRPQTQRPQAQRPQPQRPQPQRPQPQRPQPDDDDSDSDPIPF